VIPDAASTLEDRIARIEALLGLLVGRNEVREFYTVEEFARLVKRNPYTVREWARHRRILAHKKLSGRDWAISHVERLRYEREGLLPECAETGNGSLEVEGAS
jgi:hypothetical protein